MGQPDINSEDDIGNIGIKIFVHTFCTTTFPNVRVMRLGRNVYKSKNTGSRKEWFFPEISVLFLVWNWS